DDACVGALVVLDAAAPAVAVTLTVTRSVSPPDVSATPNASVPGWATLSSSKPNVSNASGATLPPLHVMAVSVFVSVQPDGDLVASPKAMPFGAVSTTLVMSALVSLAAV